MVEYIGKVSPDQIADSTWKEALKTAVNGLAAKDPAIGYAVIKGAKPHNSHKDPSDPALVMSVQLFGPNPSDYIKSVHIHQDGSVKE